MNYAFLAILAISLSFAAPVGVLAQAPATQGKEWQRVHGTVVSVQGSTLTLKADDGRTLTVDMAAVNPQVQKALTPNEKVTVIGAAGTQPNQLVAQTIQQDSSDPSRGGKVVGSQSPTTGSVDEKSWQRIHGTVTSVSGTTVMLKTDDGKTLTVDAKEVGEPIRQALKPGEAVTVIGFYKTDQSHVNARFIQQDSSAGAASPKTGTK